MALGRLFHYAVDAVLVSTVLAGVKKTSGFSYVLRIQVSINIPAYLLLSSPSTAAIGDNTLRSVTDSYLGIGETIFEMIQATAVNSPYFKRDTK